MSQQLEISDPVERRIRGLSACPCNAKYGWCAIHCPACGSENFKRVGGYSGDMRDRTGAMVGVDIDFYHCDACNESWSD